MNWSIAKSTVKTALSAHAAMGLLASALLYLVCLSGTVLVLYDEWQRLEQPAAPEMASFAPGSVQRAMEEVLALEADGPTTTHLYVHMPTAQLPRATVTTDTSAHHANADGSLVMPEENGWSEFLYDLHYTLNLPTLVGITIVGALGAIMLALAFTGVLAMPRLFRDAFRLNARSSGGIAMADWHNRLSVWTLPFTLAIAITGAVIGLATVTAYAIAEVSYDGDVEAVYATIFGAEAEGDPAPAPLPDVAAALGYMAAEHPDVAVTYAIVHDPLTAGQHVQIVGEHHRRLIFGEYYAFDAAGNFHGTAGMADGALGQQAAASVYNLHFGNYGGLPVKLAYILFGLALTAVCATGTYIWLGKRRRRGMAEPRLTAAWHGVVWGTPAALVATLAARFVLGNEAPFTAIFWILLALAVVLPVLRLTFGQPHQPPVTA
ncbi:PepSY domain-containing protein [Altererythrobacter sp. KTW20L]|uniref:PepSY-associated TM helix domain-containing protein n=1 Tax=Altererythrobacter sp. KTW20L TaxID=2942210 RepID=UPI0020BD8909|nr:PepSY-associated TM helix domain-containing protein [Altererythrobacter sp. KTW20L]MCL6250039.1 PepSY domain-containing protein [Altererythrobacter sp. KTW20L]